MSYVINKPVNKPGLPYLVDIVGDLPLPFSRMA